MTFSHHQTRDSGLNPFQINTKYRLREWWVKCILTDSTTLLIRFRLNGISNRLLIYTVEYQNLCFKGKGAFGNLQVCPPFKLGSLCNLFHMLVDVCLVAWNINYEVTRKDLNLDNSTTILHTTMLFASHSSINKRFEGSKKFNANWMRNVQKFQNLTRVKVR